MGYVDVRIKQASADIPPPAGHESWLAFWETGRRKQAYMCEVQWCGGQPDVGAHVAKVGEEGREYILPMCHACNNKPEGEVFRTWADDLVPVQWPPR